MEALSGWFKELSNDIEDAKYWAETYLGVFEDEAMNENTITNESTLSREEALALWNSMEVELERERFEPRRNVPGNGTARSEMLPGAASDDACADVDSDVDSSCSTKSVSFSETVVVVTFVNDAVDAADK
mmetsp:Transcript_12954/g.34902  ORF Transcript_12954/g.34902 Transcript_12954/m.34902 type:complete len:130 (-) Transcript_12954:23-412(-)|eukprot:CAMPEP_0185830860 /NCGR_PEP_ID=MMETSP1353-20130828/1128_1 /TAXON_ID=1077150 /ORGANISM="Erythrolobus australicus, Strain CCMP3124" /LENGTH=129 /DNA_ID=CAMNT_0028528847 /DNA_START=192 /DNA_END=581 /DNA_ORIENTATION=+